LKVFKGIVRIEGLLKSLKRSLKVFEGLLKNLSLKVFERPFKSLLKVFKSLSFKKA
jgi:hypothetical protein